MKNVSENEARESAHRMAAELRAITLEAGRKIMEVYARDFTVQTKNDASPLTEADLAAHHSIIKGLASLPSPLGTLPVLSEEGDHFDFSTRRLWSAWWLIDPLDGTKEFVKRNGEFTVNIALVARYDSNSPGIPVAGWVYAPVLDILYQGVLGYGAKRTDNAGTPSPGPEKSLPLEHPQKPPRIVASRSHRNAETDRIISSVGRRFGVGEIVSSGSSLKLCRIAEGSAELYPRAAPTMEWDSAAADAVCRAAGARVVHAQTGENLIYGKENLLNPWFLVAREDALIEESIRATSHP